MLHVLVSLIVCPKPNICCGGCCNPNTHCCDGGTNCITIPECNNCTEVFNPNNCTCSVRDNGCGVGETACGNLCCAPGQVCVPGGLDGCTCVNQ